MESIYLKYKNGYSESPDTAIAFYKDNALFFNNITGFKNEHELSLFMEVYFPCVNALVIRKQYKNAISALKLMPVIEDAIDKYRIDRADYPFYKQLLFQKACALYYLRDFGQAMELLKQLHQYEPENDTVINWMESCRLRKLSQLVYIPLLIATISMLLQFIFKRPEYARLHFVLSLIVYASVIAGVGLSFYVQFKSNKKLT